MATSVPAQTAVGAATGTDVRPVMLLTLNTPLDPAAVRFAIETALETGAELLVCDAVPLAVGQPTSSAVRLSQTKSTRCLSLIRGSAWADSAHA